jgi:hypothetical protein
MGLRSNERRASLSLLCAQTHESPFPIHAVDTPTTSAEGARTRRGREKDRQRVSLCTETNSATKRRGARAYPARSGSGGGGRCRRRRGGARRGRSRHCGPCRTSARARCSPPRPRPPPPFSLPSPPTRRDPRGKPWMAGAEGGRGAPILACARSHGRINHEGCLPRRAAPVALPCLVGSFGWQLGASRLAWPPSDGGANY